MKHQLAAVIGAAMALAWASHADATTILTFGQANSGNTITATETGGTTTTLSATNVPITITQLDSLATPISAFFDLSATSTGSASRPRH
jgi:hypothetical protein